MGCWLLPSLIFPLTTEASGHKITIVLPLHEESRDIVRDNAIFKIDFSRDFRLHLASEPTAVKAFVVFKKLLKNMQLYNRFPILNKILAVASELKKPILRKMNPR